MSNERGFVPLLYRVMAHAPGAMAGFVRFTGELRADGELPQREKELAILLVGHITGAETIVVAHRSFARQAGVDDGKLDAFAVWRHSDRFDDRERAILAYTEEVTSGLRAGDETWNAVRDHFSDAEIVELTLVVGCYNMVARFILPLEIEVDAAYEI
jgi:AhpD family alkylhydroperoxidase